jgi:coenzyme F420-reducing hydrogenase alpha subunit
VTNGNGGNGGIRVPVLARVEGEGGLEIVVSDGQVTQARLEIYEPPRFFEALLRGRRYTEPPDITARICGICPIACGPLLPGAKAAQPDAGGIKSQYFRL